MTLPQLTLILGGARSGKTSGAEGLAIETGLPKTYIATAQAYDDEMVARIAQHRIERGESWETIEEPLELAASLRAITPGRVVLVDCLTLWLSNIMAAERDLEHEFDQLVSALRDCQSPVICVSNEVGMGLVPETPLGRAFRDAQGKLNQYVGIYADLAVFMVASMHIVLKGQLP